MQPGFHLLEQKIGYLSPGDRADIRRAFDFAVRSHTDTTREDGTPYVSHPIGVAEILAGWEADRDTIIAALLHDILEDTAVRSEDILEHFGRRVALLVEGITKFTQAGLSPDLPLDRKIETLRKLFDVMRLDMRSIVIKLADRLHNVRTIAALPTPERRRKYALETLAVYYKIAYHLGMREVRRAFAEECVPHAFPEGAAEREQRDRLCAAASSIPHMIEQQLRKLHGSHLLSVSLLPRNLLLFHELLRDRGGTALAEDAFSVVVVVRTEDDCYRSLKSLHTLYRPVSGRFRDLIAAPSDAGYRSLHTSVTLPEGAVTEVRIRTPEMVEQITKGVALSLFSTGRRALPSFAWLQRSAAIDLTTRDSSSAFWEALESDVLRETISVSVDRKRLSLPKGATVLDAAYALYGVRAGHVSACTVGGCPAPFARPLREDDDVHVTFSQGERVGFGWLRFVSTEHARSHIVAVLKRTSKSKKILLGTVLLQKELDHYHKGLVQGLSKAQCQHAAEHFRRPSFDDVLSMIGEGVIRARDVVFYLFPDRRLFHVKAGERYRFRLRVSGRQQRQQDVLSQLNGVIRMTALVIDRVSIHHDSRTGFFVLSLSGSADDRLRFADFIDLLDRQEWVSDIQTLISFQQRMLLGGALAFAFALLLVDAFLFPQYQRAVDAFPLLARFFVQALPLVPILGANYYLLRLLRRYVVRMRSEQIFLGVGLLLNIFGLAVLVIRILLLQGFGESFLPLIAVFTLALGYVAYTFFHADAFLAPYEECHPLPEPQWIILRSRKIVGYLLRFLAVVTWGLVPIYIRYTPVNTLSPFLRTFLLSIGVLLSSGTLYVLRNIVWSRRLPRFSLPYDFAFFILVLGQIGYMYFENASLVYTSGTNLLLFNTFAPLLGLIVALALWRRDIPYFKQPRTILWIFLLAIMASVGSSLLIGARSVVDNHWSMFGDFLALVSTFFDVLLTVGQIQYIKRFVRTDGLLLNLHIFFFLLLFTSPIILARQVLGFSLLSHLTFPTLLLGMGTGLFIGFGQILNYESFKRIDGYLAYIMFNLSVLVTFALEAFVLQSVRPTFLLLLSGGLIISASVFAEIINSRCERKGL